MAIYIDETYFDNKTSFILVEMNDFQVANIYKKIRKLIKSAKYISEKEKSDLLSELKGSKIKRTLTKKQIHKILLSNVSCFKIFTIKCQPQEKKRYQSLFAKLVNGFDFGTKNIFADMVNTKKFMKPIKETIINPYFAFANSSTNKGIQIADVILSYYCDSRKITFEGKDEIISKTYKL